MSISHDCGWMHKQLPSRALCQPESKISLWATQSSFSNTAIIHIKIRLQTINTFTLFAPAVTARFSCSVTLSSSQNINFKMHYKSQEAVIIIFRLTLFFSSGSFVDLLLLLSWGELVGVFTLFHFSKKSSNWIHGTDCSVRRWRSWHKNKIK